MFQRPHHPSQPCNFGYCRESFKVLVTSSLDFPVKGAEITFFDEFGKVKHKAYTNAAGIALIDLAVGREYTVVQTVAPYGYHAQRRSYHLKVTKDCRFLINGYPARLLRIINKGAKKECGNDCLKEAI